MDLTVVSLFSGAGGLDFGFEKAGFNTKVCVETDSDSVSTLRTNRDWDVLQEDVRKVSSSDVSSHYGVKAVDLDLLIGGPPCQPFSKASQWVNGELPSLSDPRGNLVIEMLRLTEELLPKVVFIENVPGFGTTLNGEVLKLVCSLFDSINRKHGTTYRPVNKVLDAAEYGVPQHRKRFFLIANRDGSLFNFPISTHGNCKQLDLLEDSSSVNDFTTAWDAIGQIQTSISKDLIVEGKWGALLPSIPEGHNYQWHTRKGGGLNLFGYRTRFWAFLLKLAKDRPSWTIPANPGTATGPFHWENRRLSVKEMAALQTFPEDTQFTGNYRSVQRQIGNAVPSLMGEVLAREIGQQFFGKTYTNEIQLIPKRSRYIPRPEPICEVPYAYHALNGNHPDHPGEGLGPNQNGEKIKA